MRILIADDDEVSRCKLEALLSKWGYEVISVEDGMSAWEALQQEDAPRLTILDWMMPGMDGSEICRQLRQSRKGAYVYVLLLTSKVGKEDIVAGMEAGADDYLSKPFDAQELKVRLRAGKRIVDLEEALRVQATHDALTGAWNHGAIIDMLQRELARAEREGTSTGAVLVDLDNFKRVNDTYGHLTGDAVLREAAQRMTRELRRSDVLGRYGGEEFLVVLPGCEAPDAQGLAERLRRCIACDPVATSMGKVSFTISLGVTTTGKGERMGVAAVLQRADEALYQAKREGRNRVVVVTGSEDLPHEVSRQSSRLTHNISSWNRRSPKSGGSRGSPDPAVSWTVVLPGVGDLGRPSGKVRDLATAWHEDLSHEVSCQRAALPTYHFPEPPVAEVQLYLDLEGNLWALHSCSVSAKSGNGIWNREGSRSRSPCRRCVPAA